MLLRLLTSLRTRLLIIVFIIFIPSIGVVFYSAKAAQTDTLGDIKSKLILIVRLAVREKMDVFGEATKLFSETGLPKDSSIFIVDSQGKILSHYPNPKIWEDKVVADKEIFKAVVASQTNRETLETTDLNGEDTIAAFAKITRPSGESEFLILSVSKDAVFERIDIKFIRILFVLGAIEVLALIFAGIIVGIFLLNPINTLVSAVNKIRAGNLATRSGLKYSSGEFGQLAQAFDEMAEAIQSYTGQLEVKVAQRTKELEDSNFKVAQEKEELEKQYQLTQVLVESLPVGVFMVRMPSGEAFMANQRGYQILGISAQEQHKRNLLATTYSFLRLDQTPYPIELLPLNITIKEGRAETKNDVFIKRTDGKMVNLRISSVPVRDKNGNLVAAVMVFEEKSIEKEG